MKKQKLKTKLSLNRETIGNLTKGQLLKVKGGESEICTISCLGPSLPGLTDCGSCACSWCACY